MRTYRLIVAIICLFSALSGAKTVTLNAVADCEVKKLSPDTTFTGSGELASLHPTDSGPNPNNISYMFFRFELPADCVVADITEFKFKMILAHRGTNSTGAYFLVVFDEQSQDVNNYTWNNAPAIGRSPILCNETVLTHFEPTESHYVGYTGYGTLNTGNELVYDVSNSGYWPEMQQYALNPDTDRVLTFFIVNRYCSDDMDAWAGNENTSYHGPQIDITYESNTKKTVTLTAVSDSEVKNHTPDTSFPDDIDLASQQESPDLFTYMFFRFHLPLDCEPNAITEAKFKFVKTADGLPDEGLYLLVVYDDVPQGITVDNYTWNNAPGIGRNPVLNNTVSTHYNPSEATYVGYTTANVGVGQELVYNVVNPYRDFLMEHAFEADTDHVLTFFLVQRYYGGPPTNRWAGIEHPTYHGPQLEITYVPNDIPGAGALYPGDFLNEEETSSSSYQVEIIGNPSDDITVELLYDEKQITVDPCMLYYTISNYDTPQTVTVTAVDDHYGEYNHTSVISHVVHSDDRDYGFLPIFEVTIPLVDNDYTSTILTASADADVMSMYPDTTISANPELVPKKDDNPVDYVYSYYRFELPVDYRFALDATMKLTYTYFSSESSHLYGLAVREKASDGTVIPQGDVNSYTWNNAPGIIPPDPATAGGLSGYNGLESYFVFNFLPPTSGSAGDKQVVESAFTENILNALNDDNDGQITFFMMRRYLGSDVPRFASIDHPFHPGPQLELVYSSSAECANPEYSRFIADVNKDCIVDMADFAIMADEWLHSPLD